MFDSIRLSGNSPMLKPVAFLQILAIPLGLVQAQELAITETDEQIVIETSFLEAAIRKSGYVSGVYRGTFLDKRTGFRDPGMGLDIADFILEPGSDRAYRDQLPERMVYRFGEDLHRGRPAREVHGETPKRKIEGPQICTQAKKLDPEVIRGGDFVAVQQAHTFPMAAPGRKPGSRWEQTMVFPVGKRYFLSSQTIHSVNQSDAMFFRIDMPGHIRHQDGDSFSEVYLSYAGRIPSSEFRADFAPDEKFNYRRDRQRPPQRMIRAVHLRNPETGQQGPWLGALVLDPEVVHEAWCHQRGYVCMILEFGGRRIRPGESFSVASIIGYFDSLKEMNQVYDEHAGHRRLNVSPTGWELIP